MPSIDMTVLVLVLIFIALDWASGIIRAIKYKELDSTVMRNGLYHVCGYVLILVLAYMIDWASLHLALGFSVMLFPIAAVGIILIQIVSILENIKGLVPELENNKLLDIFDASYHNAKPENEIEVPEGYQLIKANKQEKDSEHAA